MRHNQDAIRKQDGLVDVVRDHDDRAAIRFPYVAELQLQFAAREGIEGSERFIEKQDLRIDRERTCEADPFCMPPDRRAGRREAACARPTCCRN